MNSKNDFPTSAPTASAQMVIPVRGCGNIISFKNTKMILPARGNRRAMLITDPKKQKAMDAYIRSIESVLSSIFQTSETATPTGCSQASWIASSVPLDDSRKWIPESGGWKFVEVPKGQEGADIIIEKL